MRSFLVACLLMVQVALSATVPRWSVQEVRLTAAQDHAQPDMVDVSANLSGPQGERITVPGFWDGGHSYVIRWTPTAAGIWSWHTRSADPGLNAKRGSLECRGTERSNHGFLRRDAEHPYSFVFDDGARYFLFGNTGYGIVSNALAGDTWTTYIDKTAAYGMNKMRFYLHRGNDLSRPEAEPEGQSPDQLDPKVWRKIDEIVQYMATRGMIADLILFQRAHVQQLDEAGARRWARYVVARYAAFPNVIWCLQNEWQYTNKPHEFWTALGQFVRREDPWMMRGTYQRGLSVHQQTRYDWEFFGENWYSHAIVQLGVRNRGKAHRGGDEWKLPKDKTGVFAYGDDWGSFSVRYNYGRRVPVVNDEYGYIGEPKDETEKGPDGGPIRFSREKHRRTLWAIYASGGYGSAGDKNQYPNGRPYTTANWHDVPEFGDIQHLIRFFTTKGLAYWKMSPADDVVKSGQRVYVLAEPSQAYVIYAAAGGTVTLNLPPKLFEAHRFDPRTGQDVLLDPVQGGTELAMPDNQDWVVYLKSK